MEYLWIATPTPVFHSTSTRSLPFNPLYPTYSSRHFTIPIVSCTHHNSTEPSSLISPLPLWLSNFLQSLNLYTPPDNIPHASTTSLTSIRPDNYLEQLQQYSTEYGTLFKVTLGPKAFLIVSDPVSVKHILSTNSSLYDKGILREILQPIMGQGLIPAEYTIWKERRRVLVPAFHKRWLNETLKVFTVYSQKWINQLEQQSQHEIDMQQQFSRVSLDIIGKTVFNYEFGSMSDENTDVKVIHAVYALLQEAEFRSFFLIPYWKLPFVEVFSQRQREFKSNLKLLSDTLDKLILNAVEYRDEQDIEDLKMRNYDMIQDASLLRFLVDVRGADISTQQLRDDLTTLLVAGHETNSALLTWTTYLLAKHPEVLENVHAEVDAVLGVTPASVTAEDVASLFYTRCVLSEALRLYPQPPILIRRALNSDRVPFSKKSDSKGQIYYEEEWAHVRKGSDIFILPWVLHRSERIWGERSQEFEPERWMRSVKENGSWNGYNHELFVNQSTSNTAMYPNETMTDYGFLAFGGGSRKCIGDQFAMMQSTVVLSQLLHRFDIKMKSDSGPVQMETGATIHIKHGLFLKLIPRTHASRNPDQQQTQNECIQESLQ